MRWLFYCSLRAVFLLESAMSDIAELTAKISLDDAQFISEQPRIINLSEQLTIKFDKIVQAVAGYAKKLNSTSVEVKKLSQTQSSFVSYVDNASASLSKGADSVSKASAQYVRFRENVLLAKSALQAFEGVNVGYASLGGVRQIRSEISQLKDDLKFKTDLSVNIKIGDSAGFTGEQKKVVELLNQTAGKVDKVTRAIAEYNKQFRLLVAITKSWTQSQAQTSAGIEKMTAATQQNLAVSTRWTRQLESLKNEINQLKTSAKEIAGVGLVPGSREEIKQVQGEVEKLKTELDKVKATAPAIKNAFSTIAKFTIGAFGIGEAKGMLDTYTTLTNRIKLVTQSEQQLKEVRAEIARVSSSTGQSLDATAAIYQRLAQASDQSGLSGQKLLTVTDLISKAMVIGGGSAQAQENALIQLGQAMASGKLSGDELNSVLEQAPGLAMAIAKGMGVSVGALKTLGSTGKITSQQLADAILNQSTQIQSDFSKTSRTIDQSLQNIKTQLTMFIGGSGEATGVAKLLADALQLVANNIDLIATAVVGFLGLKLTAYLLAATAEVTAFTASLVLQASVATKAAQANGVYAASLGLIKSTAMAGTFGNIIKSLATIRASMAALAATRLGALTIAFAAAAAPILAVGAAIYTVYEAGKSLIAFFKGEDASNPISNFFDNILRKIGLLKNETETLGTLLYDLTHDSYGNFRLGGTVTLKTKQEEKEGKQSQKKQNENQQAANLAPLSKEAVELKDKMQKLANNTEKAAKELGKSEEQLIRNNAQELLNQFKSKATNEAEIKAVEELVKKVNTETNKLEVGKLSEAINSAHDQIAETVKNFGKTSEQIEISKQQIALETMARKGATQAELTAAKAKVEDTQKLYAHQKALETEQKYREENNNYLQDMRTKAQELAAELSGGKDGLIAFQLAAKNASDETIRQAQATNKVVEQLQAQMQVTQALNSLSDQVAKLGMNDTQKQLYDLKKQGATSEQLKQAKAYLDQIERDKQLQEKTKKAAEKLDTAGTSLTDAAKAIGSFGLSARDNQAKEEEERKKREQEEREDSAIGFISGKGKIDDLTVDKLNIPTLPANISLPPQLKNGGLSNTKDGLTDLVKVSKIETQNLSVSNKLANDASPKSADSKASAGATETLKIDFTYNGTKLIGEVITNPIFKKQFMQFFEELIADLTKNLA